MTDTPREPETDPETQDREAPSEPEGEYTIDPVQEKGDEFARLPVEPPGV